MASYNDIGISSNGFPGSAALDRLVFNACHDHIFLFSFFLQRLSRLKPFMPGTHLCHAGAGYSQSCSGFFGQLL